jgi:hypothetical protein
MSKEADGVIIGGCPMSSGDEDNFIVWRPFQLGDANLVWERR